METEIKIEEIITSSEEPKYNLKVVIVGDSGVGKSNILTRYCSDTFTKDGQATIGVELDNKIFKVNNDFVNVSIWDTAGQERFKSITTAYYRGSQGIIIVFDLTRFDTFQHVKDWFSEVKKSANSNTQCLLIGNKSDLIELRKVTTENGTDMSKELGDLFSFFLSLFYLIILFTCFI
jgi:small GTP-binding protein